MRMYFRVTNFDRYVGMLVVAAVILAVLAVVFVARGQKWFAKRTEYRIVFDKGHGLKHGTLVTISGMEVGNVKSLTLTPGSEVELKVDVFQQYKTYIRKDSRATIVAALVGAKTVDIGAGSAKEPPIPEGGIIPSVEPRELTDILKDIDIKAPIKKLDDALDNLKSITAKLNDPRGELFALLRNVEFVTAQLKTGQGNVGAILQDTRIHGQIASALESLRRSLSSVEEVSRNASGVSRDLPGVMDQVNRVVSDIKQASARLDAILADVKSTTVHTPGIAENLKEITGEAKGITRDLKGVTGNVQKISPEIPGFLETAEEAVEDADTLVRGLQNHWLLRGTMPRPKDKMPAAIEQRETAYSQGEDTKP